MSLNVDLLLIGRCLAAVLWGVLLALTLQFTRVGQYLSERQMWFVVSVGAGVNLLIGFNAAWLTLVLIFAGSSLGIIARAVINQSRQAEPDLHAYRTKWGMEDAIDRLGDLIGLLQRTLEEGNGDKKASLVSQALSKAHQAQRAITTARYGEPERTNKRAAPTR